MNFIHRYQPALSWVNEFDRLLSRSRFDEPARSAPREVLHESDEAWTLRLDLPGYPKEGVSITVTDRTLQLVAEALENHPFGGKFERQWKLGEDVDAAAVSARLEDGVLVLTLPKRPKSEPQSIKIEIH